MAAHLQGQGPSDEMPLVCAQVRVLLEGVRSSSGVVTGPKFTQKCVARGREVLQPPLAVKVEFQRPASPISPGCNFHFSP